MPPSRALRGLSSSLHILVATDSPLVVRLCRLALTLAPRALVCAADGGHRSLTPLFPGFVVDKSTGNCALTGVFITIHIPQLNILASRQTCLFDGRIPCVQVCNHGSACKFATTATLTERLFIGAGFPSFSHLSGGTMALAHGGVCFVPGIDGLKKEEKRLLAQGRSRIRAHMNN